MRQVALGAEESLVFRVAENMAAEFGGRRVHAVLSTWALVHHLEWAARRVIEPALEQGEVGVGVGVDIRHLAPAPIGAQVTVTARAVEAREGTLVCDVEARCGERPLARGRVFQAVLAQAQWDALRMEGAPARDGEE